MNRILRIAALLALPLLSVACNSTTVLLANFNAEPVGAPPAFNQPTGTVVLDEQGTGTVRVAVSPIPTSPGNKWARGTNTAPNTGTSALRAQFDGFHGPGKYNVVAALFIPTGAGAVTLQLEPASGGASSFVNFLHVDFMPENDVRLNDDNATRFGSFPRDQSFVVSINVDTASTPRKATVTLLGGVATGSRDVVLPSLSTQFGAVRVWMGFQFQGSFFVDDILVTKSNS